MTKDKIVEVLVGETYSDGVLSLIPAHSRDRKLYVRLGDEYIPVLFAPTDQARGLDDDMLVGVLYRANLAD